MNEIELAVDVTIEPAATSVVPPVRDAILAGTFIGNRDAIAVHRVTGRRTFIVVSEDLLYRRLVIPISPNSGNWKANRIHELLPAGFPQLTGGIFNQQFNST